MKKNFGGLGGTCQAQSSKIMQNHVMPKSSKCHAQIVQNELLLQAVHTCTPWSNSIFSAPNRAKKAILPGLDGQVYPGRMRGRAKKTGPVKKRMASWARQRQQITEAADGGARACTGADGAVVLNLRRGPGACALPAASQQGLRLQPAPHPRGAQRLHPAAQRAEEARALPAGRRAPADQAGQGLLPRQVLRVPGPRAGDHPSGGTAGGTPARATSAGTGCR